MRKTDPMHDNSKSARDKMITSFSKMVDHLAESLFTVGYKKDEVAQEMPIKVFFVIYNHLIAVLTGKRGREKEVKDYFRKRGLIAKDNDGNDLLIYQTREFHLCYLEKAGKIAKILRNIRFYIRMAGVGHIIQFATNHTLREYYKSMPAHGAKKLDSQFVLEDLLNVGIKLFDFFHLMQKDRLFMTQYPDFMESVCQDPIPGVEQDPKFQGIELDGELMNAYMIPYLIRVTQHLYRKLRRGNFDQEKLSTIFEHLIASSEDFFSANFIGLINHLVLFSTEAQLQEINWHSTKIRGQAGPLQEPELMMVFVKVLVVRYLSFREKSPDGQISYVMDLLQIYPEDFDILSQSVRFESIGANILRGEIKRPAQDLPPKYLEIDNTTSQNDKAIDIHEDDLESVTSDPVMDKENIPSQFLPGLSVWDSYDSDAPDTEEARRIRAIFSDMFTFPEVKAQPDLPPATSSVFTPSNFYAPTLRGINQSIQNAPQSLLSFAQRGIQNTTDTVVQTIGVVTNGVRATAAHSFNQVVGILSTVWQGSLHTSQAALKYTMRSIDSTERYFYGEISYAERLGNTLDCFAQSLTQASLMQLRPVLRLLSIDQATLAHPETYSVLINKSDKIARILQNLVDLHASIGVLHHLLPMLQSRFPILQKLSVVKLLEIIPSLQNICHAVHAQRHTLDADSLAAYMPMLVASLENTPDTLALSGNNSTHTTDSFLVSMTTFILQQMSNPLLYEAFSKNLPIICIAIDHGLAQDDASPIRAQIIDHTLSSKASTSYRLYSHYQCLQLFGLLRDTLVTMRDTPDMYNLDSVQLFFRDLHNQLSTTLYSSNPLSADKLTQCLFESIKQQATLYQAVIDNRKILAYVLREVRSLDQHDMENDDVVAHDKPLLDFIARPLNFLDTLFGIDACVMRESYLPILPEIFDHLDQDNARNIQAQLPLFLASLFSSYEDDVDPRYQFSVTPERLKTDVFPWLHDFLRQVNSSTLTKEQSSVMLINVIDPFFFELPKSSGNFIALVNNYNKLANAANIAHSENPQTAHQAKALTSFCKQLLLRFTATKISPPFQPTPHTNATDSPVYLLEPYVNPMELDYCWTALDIDDIFTSTLRGKQAVMPATDYAEPFIPPGDHQSGTLSWPKYIKDSIEFIATLIAWPAVSLVSILISVISFTIRALQWVWEQIQSYYHSTFGTPHSTSQSSRPDSQISTPTKSSSALEEDDKPENPLLVPRETKNKPTTAIKLSGSSNARKKSLSRRKNGKPKQPDRPSKHLSRQLGYSPNKEHIRSRRKSR